MVPFRRCGSQVTHVYDTSLGGILSRQNGIKRTNGNFCSGARFLRCLSASAKTAQLWPLSRRNVPAYSPVAITGAARRSLCPLGAFGGVLKMAHKSHMESRAEYTTFFKRSRQPFPGLSGSSNWRVLARVAPFLWPADRSHRIRVVAAASSLILSKIATIQAPLLLGQLIDSLSAASVAVESATAATAAAGVVNPWIALGLVSGYGLARISGSGFNELRNAVFSRVSNSACTIVACNTFEHLHRLDLDFLLLTKSGELGTILSRGIRSVTQLLNTMLFQIFPTFLEFVLVLSLLYWKLGPLITGVTTATMIAYIIFTTRLTAKRTLYRKSMNLAEQKAAGVMMDSLINAEAVRYFMNENFEKARYASCQKEYENGSVKVAESLAALNFGQQFIFNVGLWSSMAITAFQISSGTLPLGSMAFISSLLFQLAIPLNMLGSVYRETRLNLVDLEKGWGVVYGNENSLPRTTDGITVTWGRLNTWLNDILSLQPKCVSPPNPKPFEFRHGKIKFENLQFEYRPQNELLEDLGIRPRTPEKPAEKRPEALLALPVPVTKSIFSGLDMEVLPTWKVGIVGGSGSGKTSLIKLLYRLYDPQRGRVLIDDQDIRELSLESFRLNVPYRLMHRIRKYIGIVPQDVVLFNNTILYNLRYGRPDASFEKIVEATKAAQIYDTIMNNFPLGFDTLVGERGLKLSGGEKQRIGIARCLLRNPPVVILDEATSALDSETEHHVLKALRAMSENRTSIVIAHRLSTIVDADRIYVLGNGRVQEYGTHEELLSRPRGRYAEMWRYQLKLNTLQTAK